MAGSCPIPVNRLSICDPFIEGKVESLAHRVAFEAEERHKLAERSPNLSSHFDAVQTSATATTNTQ